jgi:hypothetical protein
MDDYSLEAGNQNQNQETKLPNADRHHHDNATQKMGSIKK